MCARHRIDDNCERNLNDSPEIFVVFVFSRRKPLIQTVVVHTLSIDFKSGKSKHEKFTKKRQSDAIFEEEEEEKEEGKKMIKKE